MEYFESIVAKFGGSSLADAESISQVAEIIKSDHRRRWVVVSAPGRRFSGDQKITDLLIKGEYDLVGRRFVQIAQNLGCLRSVSLVENMVRELEQSGDREWIVSRGEWMIARIMAEYLKARFVDASTLIRINQNREVEQASYRRINEKLTNCAQIVVIPGFYGRGADGKILTLPRNGSDISGAVVARGVGAGLYEVWTDVDGVWSSDPRLSSEADFMPELSFDQMSYMDSQVLHPDSIRPVAEVEIPVNVRNTFNPLHSGSLIRSKKTSDQTDRPVRHVLNGNILREVVW